MMTGLSLIMLMSAVLVALHLSSVKIITQFLKGQKQNHNEIKEMKNFEKKNKIVFTGYEGSENVMKTANKSTSISILDV